MNPKSPYSILALISGLLIITVLSVYFGQQHEGSDKSRGSVNQALPIPASTPSSSTAPSSGFSQYPAAPGKSLSVTILPVNPNAPQARIVAPVTLAAGWDQGYQLYRYANGETPDYRGEPVKAYVEAAGNKTILNPNQLGMFPRIYLNPSDKVNVAVQYPQGKAGDRVAVVALDGGTIDGTNSNEILTLNDRGIATLNFTLSENQGVCRVSMQKGTETTFLDFWAGTDNVFPQLISKK